MSDWFIKYREGADPKLRLFCFPYAGGSANVFSDWHESLPADIDLFAIQSPGRGRRFSEPPIGRLRTKVNLIHGEILRFTDVPYVFFGHSNGALFAYELARELQKSGNCNLSHIILSAKRAPHLREIKEPIHHLPRREFCEKLREFDFTPEEVLQNEELMELFLPMLQADFALSETHEFEREPLLESATTLFWGNTDTDVPFEDVYAWRDLIRGDLNTIEFDDGHFFIDKQKRLVLEKVNAILQESRDSITRQNSTSAA